ncbi:MAG: ATP-binding protein [Lentimicrobiaceae bacterium]|jgi:MinD superfamily P-loop ATPase|nr:ATP-binding protein [Lentimicrobiaceae bacterium]MDD4599079.1 ATP-binding protein [Lentimicrobiaceae bacterium]MDY0026806.1 ATP-binding protein [Lentimicrobium sp.]
MKEIVIISGKGGTGKTSITASFAVLGGTNVVLADCDVDAADMHLLMQPDFGNEHDFYSGELAYIDQSNCTRCGLCRQICRFDAISVIDGEYVVAPIDCEGCGYCARVCPTKTIINKKLLAGKWYISNIKTGSQMVHARLETGADNSGKLVAKVKDEAKAIALGKRKDYILVDGSPGVGCPVVSSLSGANFVVLVTEPSVSGLHDLKRVHQLVKKFNIRAGCIINKADINPGLSNDIKLFLEKENIAHLADLPYNEDFTMAMTQGETIVEYRQGTLTALIKESWEKIKVLTNQNKIK